MAQPVEVMENHAQEFINFAESKGFVISQEFIDAVVGELKAVGLFREKVSLKSYKMGLSAALDSGRIQAPVQKPINIERAAEALQNTFPPVMTERQLRKQKQDAAANAGIAAQSGRITHSQRKDIEKKASHDIAIVRDLSRLAELRTEYRSLRAKAETAMSETRPQSHAANYAERKRLLAELNSDPRFAEVRS